MKKWMKISLGAIGGVILLFAIDLICIFTINRPLFAIKEGFGIGIGNPIHYNNDEYVVIKTSFNLPNRKFNIGYLTTSQNELIDKFIKLF